MGKAASFWERCFSGSEADSVGVGVDLGFVPDGNSELEA